MKGMREKLLIWLYSLTKRLNRLKSLKETLSRAYTNEFKLMDCICSYICELGVLFIILKNLPLVLGRARGVWTRWISQGSCEVYEHLIFPLWNFFLIFGSAERTPITRSKALQPIIAIWISRHIYEPGFSIVSSFHLFSSSYLKKIIFFMFISVPK